MTEGPGQEAGEFQLDRSERGGEQRTFGDDHDVDGVGPVPAEDLADTALRQVALDGVPEFTARGYAEPAQAFGPAVDHHGHQRSVTLQTGLEHD